LRKRCADKNVTGNLVFVVFGCCEKRLSGRLGPDDAHSRQAYQGKTEGIERRGPFVTHYRSLVRSIVIVYRVLNGRSFWERGQDDNLVFFKAVACN